MNTITGTYHNGKLKLDKPLETEKPIRVELMIVEDASCKRLNISDFSYLETQQLLENCKSSFAEEVIDERRRVENLRFTAIGVRNKS